MTGLILAGSHEARTICDKQKKKKIPAIASLAGVTKKPLNLSLKTHFGGFGGLDGFKNFIQNEKIEWVINATHPFASTIRNTSTKICKELKISHLLINRPEWYPEISDDWHYINDLKELNNIIPCETNVLIGTGRNTLSQFQNMTERNLLCRVIDIPDTKFPFKFGKYLIGMPPFSVQE
ncbi:MAG: precorrin-6A/cobalt-precorrin-6A reductase, partial [Amylibacter sp.]|nr:precorrin-6A/cobalt-precorrin-6A reductase [Amylibacter sp.]